MMLDMPVDATELLARLGNADRGFGPNVGQPSEPEPTALAALAFDDARAREWLAEHQREDGSFSIDAGPYVNDSATGSRRDRVRSGPRAERALDHLESTHGRRLASSSAVPIDPSAIGWAWARGPPPGSNPRREPFGPCGWRGPSLHGSQMPWLCFAIGIRGRWMELRESRGTWRGTAPFAQTTAIALIGLSGLDADLEARGLRSLGRLWRVESAGGLSLATALVAFREHGRANEARGRANHAETPRGTHPAPERWRRTRMGRTRDESPTAVGRRMSPLDRRTFLRRTAAGAAVAAAGGLGLRALLREPEPWDEAAFPPQETRTSRS